MCFESEKVEVAGVEVKGEDIEVKEAKVEGESDSCFKSDIWI